MPCSFLSLSASPRAGGNSDTAASLFQTAFAAALQQHSPQTDALPGRPEYVRAYNILPCASCGACEQAAGFSAPLPGFGCPLAARDTSAILLDLLLRSDVLCLAAPIYFYHLPALFKGFIDRMQPFWHLERKQSPLLQEIIRPRVCCPILIAGRPKGDSLFQGSLLTLRYALRPLGFRLASPLLLMGLDTPDSVARSESVREQITEYARAAANDACQERNAG